MWCLDRRVETRPIRCGGNVCLGRIGKPNSTEPWIEFPRPNMTFRFLRWYTSNRGMRTMNPRRKSESGHLRHVHKTVGEYLAKKTPGVSQTTRSKRGGPAAPVVGEPVTAVNLPGWSRDRCPRALFARRQSHVRDRWQQLVGRSIFLREKHARAHGV